MLDYEMKVEWPAKELDGEIDKLARALGKVNFVIAMLDDVEVRGSKVMGQSCRDALGVAQAELKATITQLILIQYK